MKKLVFVVIAVLLVGGGFYLSNNMTKESPKTNLDKAIESMNTKNNGDNGLKSLAMVTATTTQPIELTDIALYEAALPEAQPRIDRIRGTGGYREIDETKLKAIFTTNNIPFTLDTDLGKRILDLGRAIKDDYKTGITSLINELPTSVDKVAVRKLTDKINDNTVEARNVQNFKTWYEDTVRPFVCTTNDRTSATDKNPSIFFKGTTTFTYPKAPAPAQIEDECVTTGTLSQVKERLCTVGVLSRPSTVSGQENPKLTTCEYGCSLGACKRGKLGTVSLLNAVGGTAVTSRQVGESFFIQVKPEKVTEATAVTVTVGTPTGCTLTTKTQTVATSGNTLNFGPIVCSVASTGTGYSFPISLKTGTTEIESQTVTMPYGGIQMSHFTIDVVNPTKIGIGTPVTINVKAIGSTNLTFPTYTEKFDVIINDENADYERKQYSLVNGVLQIKNIKFSQSGDFKITIRSGMYEGETTVNVKASPQASLSGRLLPATNSTPEYVDRSITVAAGDQLELRWTSGSFGTATSSVTASTASCNKTWLTFNATSESGSQTFTVPSGLPAGCSWTVVYNVRNSVSSTIGSDSFVISN